MWEIRESCNARDRTDPGMRFDAFCGFQGLSRCWAGAIAWGSGHSLVTTQLQDDRLLVWQGLTDPDNGADACAFVQL